jgi:glycosyltransferase involved in cell wall biosynthesis
MKICLTSFAAPWFFGPYGQQLKLIANNFLSKNHEVYYLLLSVDLPMSKISYRDLIMKENGRVDKVNNDLFQKIKFIGGISKMNGKVFVSNINQICEKFKIDSILFLMDLTKLCMDQSFSADSAVWYPNHFMPINHENRKKLSFFNKILSLCPSDQKNLQQIFPNKLVEYVPHIIDFDYEPDSKKVLRQKYKLPSTDFIVFIHGGNYDLQNRKSLDTSLFAFDKYHKLNPNSFLLIHSYDVRKIDVNNHYTPKKNFLELDDLLSYLSIPKDKVKIIDDILPFEDILDLMSLSDVLLQGSKSEGFGLPVLESQLIGTPVITTKFGAMSDFTYYGISVEPIQDAYDQFGMGVWCTPSINGIADALDKIASKKIENKKQYAIEEIQTNMNEEAVSESILKSLQKKVNENPDNNQIDESFLQVIIVKNNKYYIDDKPYDKLEPMDIRGEYIIFIGEDFIYQKSTLTKFCRQNTLYDMVVFPTKYKTMTYPMPIDLQSNNLNPQLLNFAIRSKFVKVCIEENILPKNMKGFTLLSHLPKLKVNVSDKTMIIEKAKG